MVPCFYVQEDGKNIFENIVGYGENAGQAGRQHFFRTCSIIRFVKDKLNHMSLIEIIISVKLVFIRWSVTLVIIRSEV